MQIVVIVIGVVMVGLLGYYFVILMKGEKQ